MPVALIVSIAQMVLVVGTTTVLVPFPSMARCLEVLPHVLKQPTVSSAFCIDTSRMPPAPH